MRSRLNNQTGAALVTVLLFMTLTFILITSMLTVTGNEIVISGIQRDSTRALDLAQAGIDEAKMRIAEGRPFMTLPNWRSSIDRNGGTDPNVTVKVIRNYVGTNSAYLEIQSDATVGRARRRLSALVLQRMISFPPNITFAASVIQQGSAEIICGDAYARTFIQYKNYPINSADCTEPPPITYGGWRMSKGANATDVPFCYSHKQCVDSTNTEPNPPFENEHTNRWYPGQRRTEPANTIDGKTILSNTNKCPDGGGGLLDSATVVGVLAESPTACNDLTCPGDPYYQTYPKYGFFTDDPDDAGPIPPQAVIPGVLPCGLPYMLIPDQFTADDGDGQQRTRLFKTILFEHWFALYWAYCESPTADPASTCYQKTMTFAKKRGNTCDPAADPYCLSGNVEPNLLAYPQFGAVPPFPELDSVNQNFDCRKDGGGVLNSASVNCDEPSGVTSDLGCKYPEMACAGNKSREVGLVLNGDWTLNGVNFMGHGTIVINGDLTVTGNVEYWGTIIVNGTMTLGAGSVTIHGGLVADSTLKISGNINVEGGGTVGMVPTGRSIVIGRGWWER